jgi:hypothetical protein
LLAFSFNDRPQQISFQMKISSFNRRQMLALGAMLSSSLPVVVVVRALVPITDPHRYSRTIMTRSSSICRLPLATSLCYSKDENNEATSNNAFDPDGIFLLRERIQQIKVEIMEEELRRPPNPDFSAEEFVAAVMDGLLNPYDPRPDAGFRLLLRASTKAWRNTILQSIGARDDSDMELVASALGAAIGRPHNQFAILVGCGEDYQLHFGMSEPVDYGDGKCWVECRLRAKQNGELLLITGWQLRQRDDGAWLIDGIDWQDFRDEFRPGIGREEWYDMVRLSSL